MDQKSTIIHGLKARGHKMTAVRQAVIQILVDEHGPFTVKDLRGNLVKHHLTPNKTTLYREIDFLERENIIQSIDFGDGMKRYEIASTEHHHHAVCNNCGAIEDIALENDLIYQEKHIEQSTRFKVFNHSLEFFGLCFSCQKEHP